MIVVDASAMVPALSDSSTRGDTARAELSKRARWLAPAHMPIEVVRTFDRLARTATLPADRAEVFAMHMHTGIGAAVTLVSDPALLPTIWRLRADLSAYDAAYVALGEQTGCPLMTADARLARAADRVIDIVMI